MDYFGYSDAAAYANGAGIPNPRAFHLDDDWRGEEAYEARVLNKRLKTMRRRDVGVHLGEYLEVYGSAGAPRTSAVAFAELPEVNMRRRPRKQANPRRAAGPQPVLHKILPKPAPKQPDFVWLDDEHAVEYWAE